MNKNKIICETTLTHSPSKNNDCSRNQTNKNKTTFPHQTNLYQKSTHHIRQFITTTRINQIKISKSHKQYHDLKNCFSIYIQLNSIHLVTLTTTRWTPSSIRYYLDHPQNQLGFISIQTSTQYHQQGQPYILPRPG
jgi:hypothetical protein